MSRRFCKTRAARCLPAVRGIAHQVERISRFAALGTRPFPLTLVTAAFPFSTGFCGPALPDTFFRCYSFRHSEVQESIRSLPTSGCGCNTFMIVEAQK